MGVRRARAAVSLSLAAVAALAGCSTSGTSHVPTPAASTEEGHGALAAEMPTTPPPPAPTPGAPPSGPFYEPDPGGRPVAILRGDAPNVRYASLGPAACEAELGRRGIAFARADAAPPGVLAPVRLRGPLHGVTVRSTLSPAERAKSTLEIFDCRLVLALDDFAAIVAAHDVVEMIHLSAFRARAQGGCTPKYAGKQHCAALAVDIASFKKRDGSTLVVLRDFKGRIGTPTCTEAELRKPRDRSASELWGFVCDAARRAVFHVMLTPNFNAQHKNHLHLEITPDAGWMLIK